MTAGLNKLRAGGKSISKTINVGSQLSARGGCSEKKRNLFYIFLTNFKMFGNVVMRHMSILHEISFLLLCYRSIYIKLSVAML